MIRYLDAFSDFNPLLDALPEQHFWQVGYLLQESLAVLPKDYTMRDLNAGLEILQQVRRHESDAIWEYRAEDRQQEGAGVFHSMPLKYYLCSQRTEKGGDCQPSCPINGV